MLDVDIAWSQIIGSRQSQQDSANVLNWPDGFRLMILADGMGGHQGGGVASRIVVESVRQHFIESSEEDLRERLLDALEAANLAVYEQIKKNPELSGMGTTLVAVTFDGLSIRWISVGDSPLWLIRQGGLERLNENHSMSTELAKQVEAGELSAEEAIRAPERSQLLEAVMGESIKKWDAPEAALALQPDDTLILASDGVESCSEQQLAGLVSRHQGDAVSLTSRILQAVEHINKPGQDNATLIIIKVLQANADPDSPAPRAEEIVAMESRTL